MRTTIITICVLLLSVGQAFAGDDDDCLFGCGQFMVPPVPLVYNGHNTEEVDERDIEIQRFYQQRDMYNKMQKMNKQMDELERRDRWRESQERARETNRMLEEIARPGLFE